MKSYGYFNGHRGFWADVKIATIFCSVGSLLSHPVVKNLTGRKTVFTCVCTLLSRETSAGDHFESTR